LTAHLLFAHNQLIIMYTPVMSYLLDAHKL